MDCDDDTVVVSSLSRPRLRFKRPVVSQQCGTESVGQVWPIAWRQHAGQLLWGHFHHGEEQIVQGAKICRAMALTRSPYEWCGHGETHIQSQRRPDR